MTDVVDLKTVCILRMADAKPGRSQNSVAPNGSYASRVKELVTRGYLSQPARFSGVTLTPEGKDLLDRLMRIVEEFELESRLDELVVDTIRRAKHKGEYAKGWNANSR